MDDTIDELLSTYSTSIEEPHTLSIEDPHTLSIEDPCTLSIEDPHTLSIIEEPYSLSISSEIEGTINTLSSVEDLDYQEQPGPLATSTPCKKRRSNAEDIDSTPNVSGVINTISHGQSSTTAERSTTTTDNSEVVKDKRIENMNSGDRRVVSSALKNGLKVLSFEDLRNLLRQMNQKPETLNTKATVKVRKLKPPFIKIEDQSRQYRPIFKEFKKWPTITFSDQDVLIKGETKKKKKKTLFCEHCQEFDIKNLDKHLKSMKHRTIVSQKGYWDGVDKLIMDNKKDIF
ncbi:Protein DBF4-like B [Exaiptasia diaphana]|nr:Protein DBF4-like B [Exaiptasia diaphana]